MFKYVIAIIMLIEINRCVFTIIKMFWSFFGYAGSNMSAIIQIQNNNKWNQFLIIHCVEIIYILNRPHCKKSIYYI